MPNRVEQCRKAILSEDVMDFFILYNGDEERLFRTYQPDCIQLTNGRHAILYFSKNQNMVTEELRYANDSFPKCYGLMEQGGLEATGILRLRRQPYPDLTGRNVLLGFVDTGINYQDSFFVNPDDTSRVVAIWDQTIQDGPIPNGIYYGTEYNHETLNRAVASENPLEIVPSQDEDGHGTRMAAIAAANIDIEQNFSGAAPLADIAMVKLKPAKKYLRDYYFIKEGAICFQETDIILGVRYLLDLALRREQPIAICIGLGTNAGDHNGTLVLDQYLDLFSNYIGNCIVTSGGNEGNSSCHYRSRYFGRGMFSGLEQGLQIDQDGKYYEDVQFRVAERERGFMMEMWAQTPNLFSVSVISPSGESVSVPYYGIDSSNTFRFLFENTTLYTDFRVNEASSGDPFLAMRFATPAAGIWTLRIIDERNFGGTFDLWLPIRQFIEVDTYFLMPDPDVTICGPGNAMLPITVSAYNHRNDSIGLESSRGYTRKGMLKPDIAAPGVGIEIPGYGIYTGTSLSAAYTAGAAALLLEWGIIQENYIYIKTREIKNMMIMGAVRKDIVYPNRQWGYGALNLYETFDSLRATRF